MNSTRPHSLCMWVCHWSGEQEIGRRFTPAEQVVPVLTASSGACGRLTPALGTRICDRPQRGLDRIDDAIAVRRARRVALTATAVRPRAPIRVPLRGLTRPHHVLLQIAPPSRRAARVTSATRPLQLVDHRWLHPWSRCAPLRARPCPGPRRRRARPRRAARPRRSAQGADRRRDAPSASAGLTATVLHALGGSCSSLALASRTASANACPAAGDRRPVEGEEDSWAAIVRLRLGVHVGGCGTRSRGAGQAPVSKLHADGDRIALCGARKAAAAAPRRLRRRRRGAPAERPRCPGSPPGRGGVDECLPRFVSLAGDGTTDAPRPRTGRPWRRGRCRLWSLPRPAPAATRPVADAEQALLGDQPGPAAGGAKCAARAAPRWCVPAGRGPLDPPRGDGAALGTWSSRLLLSRMASEGASNMTSLRPARCPPRAAAGRTCPSGSRRGSGTPRRSASTRLSATIRASAAGTLAASRIAAAKSRSRSAADAPSAGARTTRPLQLDRRGVPGPRGPPSTGRAGCARTGADAGHRLHRPARRWASRHRRWSASSSAPRRNVSSAARRECPRARRAP